MVYLEIAISFIIGLLSILLLGWVFSLKTKGLIRLALNAIAGAAVLVILTLCSVVILPLNPLNALIAGLMGLPGLVVIYLIAVFL